jgi:Fe2+ or Zn2+ uptake regulation protein
LTESRLAGRVGAMDFVDERSGAVTALRTAGLRITSPRIAVLLALRAAPHATADTVAEVARRTLGSVSKQAVYDALDAFTGAGLVRRIEPAGSAARYETRTGDNHHHLVCRSCGLVADVDCVVAAAPCLTPSQELGFVIDEAEVVFWGYCSPCRELRTTELRDPKFPDAKLQDSKFQNTKFRNTKENAK